VEKEKPNAVEMAEKTYAKKKTKYEKKRVNKI